MMCFDVMCLLLLVVVCCDVLLLVVVCFDGGLSGRFVKTECYAGLSCDVF